MKLLSLLFTDHEQPKISSYIIKYASICGKAIVFFSSSSDTFQIYAYAGSTYDKSALLNGA